MKFNLSFSKVFSFMLTLLFFIGIHNSIQAQINVINATGCNITVFVGQSDLSTAVPCDLCPINPPTPVNIGIGGSQNIFGQDICGEEALWLAWQIGGIGAFGISPNPGLFAACVPNIPGAPCFFGPTNAFWVGGGGTGFVTVVLF